MSNGAWEESLTWAGATIIVLKLDMFAYCRHIRKLFALCSTSLKQPKHQSFALPMSTFAISSIQRRMSFAIRGRTGAGTIGNGPHAFSPPLGVSVRPLSLLVVTLDKYTQAQPTPSDGWIRLLYLTPFDLLALTDFHLLHNPLSKTVTRNSEDLLEGSTLAFHDILTVDDQACCRMPLCTGPVVGGFIYCEFCHIQVQSIFESLEFTRDLQAAADPLSPTDLHPLVLAHFHQSFDPTVRQLLSSASQFCSALSWWWRFMKSVGSSSSGMGRRGMV